uniref:Uncharacterized protein n=1 Tax=Podoviridae sp. ct6BA50 TaxID=2825221 RepID=A0A8S5VG63_9CAUD|nr:MAG TPA: hypothetical protein [Podoviridae sp. ct6BA50]
MSRATNKSTSRSCSRLAWASRFSIAAMYSSLFGMIPLPPLRNPGIPYSPAIRRWLHRAHILSFSPAGLPWPGGFLVPFLHRPPRFCQPVSGDN